jgi:hypothetical protein
MSINEMVDHPRHYQGHPKGIEAIDVIEDNPFSNLSNAMKYLWRVSWGSKENDIQDLEKAVWSINREIARRQPKEKAEQYKPAFATGGYTGAKVGDTTGFVDNGYVMPKVGDKVNVIPISQEDVDRINALTRPAQAHAVSIYAKLTGDEREELDAAIARHPASGPQVKAKQKVNRGVVSLEDYRKRNTDPNGDSAA